MTGVDGPARSFWAWFAACEVGLAARAGGSFPSEVVDEIHAYLKRSGLVDVFVEVGPACDSGRRQLVLTVHGRRDGVPALERLAAAAPRLERWELTMFRPPLPAGVELTHEGTTYRSADFEFSAGVVQGSVVVVLYAKGVEEADGPGSEAALLMMDALAGEELAVKAIDYVSVHPFDAPAAGGMDRCPLFELPEALEAMLEWKASNRP